MDIAPKLQKYFKSLGFELIALNQHFVVINKSGGIGFHDELERPGDVDGLGDVNDETRRVSGIFTRVQNALLEQGVISSKLYPLHRLDKGTSGLLIFGRTKAVAQELGEAFAEGRVQKFYLALSRFKPKKKQGAVKGGMEKARRGAWKLGKSKGNYAVSQFFSVGLGNGLRLFLWRPKSGRTHQLRVAMKSLGSPILGDSLYGCDAEIGHGDQFCLHAFQLSFDLQGDKYIFQTSIANDDALLAQWSVGSSGQGANLEESTSLEGDVNVGRDTKIGRGAKIEPGDNTEFCDNLGQNNVVRIGVLKEAIASYANPDNYEWPDLSR